jgi:uncharacterized protein (TIGR00369 family)
MKVAYHRPITVDTDPVQAEARIVTIGKRVAFAEGRVTDAEGRICASSPAVSVAPSRRRTGRTRSESTPTAG